MWLLQIKSPYNGNRIHMNVFMTFKFKRYQTLIINGEHPHEKYDKNMHM